MTRKKTKNLPIKVWLDEESCWNNEPQYSEGYVEYVREDYHAQALLHVLNKGVKQGRKEMLDEVCEWLKEHSGDYLLYPFCEFDKGELVKDFEKAMKDRK